MNQRQNNDHGVNPGKKSRPILVVEDDSNLRHLIIRTIHRDGYAGEGVGTGARALERIKENPQQILLLDQRLPDMTGIQVINKLLEQGFSIPFIVMTGQGDERIAVEMMKLGAADYLVKGTDFFHLLPRALKRLLKDLQIKKRLQDAENAVFAAEHRLCKQYELSIALSKARTLKETLTLSLEAALEVTQLDCGGIYLLDEESGVLSLAVHQGLSPAFISQAARFPPDSPQFSLVMSGEPVYTNYPLLEFPVDSVRRQEALQAIGIVPIFFEDSVIASFNMASHTQGEIDPGDQITLESIAAQIGTFIARVKAEEELKKREYKYRAVFEGIHDAIVIVNEAGKFIDCNTQALQMFGLQKKEDFEKKRPADFSPWYQPDGRKSQEVSRQFITRAMEGGENLLFEWQHQRQNGETFWAEVMLSAYLMGEEKVLQSTIRDISTRKGTEGEIKARNQELTALYRLSTHMRSAKKSQELLPIVLDEVIQLLQANTSMVLLFSPEEDLFSVIEARGYWEKQGAYNLQLSRKVYEEVLQKGHPYITADFHEVFSSLPPGPDVSWAVLVPLQSEENMLGILVVARFQNSENKPFSFSEVHLLMAIGEMAGNALRRQKLHESSQQQMEQLQSLRRIDTAITSNLDLHSILNLTLSQVTQLLQVDAAAILRLYPGQFLKYSSWCGFSSNLRSMTFNPSDGWWQGIISKRTLCLVPDITRVDIGLGQHPLFQQEGFVGYAALPLVARDTVQGILEVYQRQPLHQAKDWFDFLKTLAGQAAIAIDNDHLFTSLEYANIELTLAYDATIEGWAYALDLRDEETEGHSQRVTQMTIMLAMDMDIPEEELVHLRRATLLHDIGKMGIPDSILRKPQSLTREEWKIMRKHPQYAWEMLYPIEYLRPALHVPFSHHEKWDGSGYPQGLMGQSIPLEARLFAVVDVYDALISDRPYRSAWSRDKALDFICQEREKHFDPQVIDLFLARFG